MISRMRWLGTPSHLAGPKTNCFALVHVSSFQGHVDVECSGTGTLYVNMCRGWVCAFKPGGGEQFFGNRYLLQISPKNGFWNVSPRLATNSDKMKGCRRNPDFSNSRHRSETRVIPEIGVLAMGQVFEIKFFIPCALVASRPAAAATYAALAPRAILPHRRRNKHQV